MSAVANPGLLDRLAAGPLICAEGYLFELERRGYLQAGAFVPEVVLDHPEQVTALHEQFVHAGSDVVEAFTYYAHREKLRLVGKEDLLEPMNRQALELARQVAAEHGALFAGDVCNTTVYDPADHGTHTQVRAMFDEQVGWAAEAGVDFVIGETFRYLGEAEIALDVIRRAGLPAAMTLVVDHDAAMRDGPSLPDACRRLAGAGADVV
ncbi:MAG: homocysteine S-methyltransferase family protein, partial [Haloechinothrix sp.]